MNEIFIDTSINVNLLDINCVLQKVALLGDAQRQAKHTCNCCAPYFRAAGGGTCGPLFGGGGGGAPTKPKEGMGVCGCLPRSHARTHLCSHARSHPRCDPKAQPRTNPGSHPRPHSRGGGLDPACACGAEI